MENFWITPSSLTAQVPQVVVGGGGAWAQAPSLGVWGGRRETEQHNKAGTRVLKMNLN